MFGIFVTLAGFALFMSYESRWAKRNFTLWERLFISLLVVGIVLSVTGIKRSMYLSEKSHEAYSARFSTLIHLKLPDNNSLNRCSAGIVRVPAKDRYGSNKDLKFALGSEGIHVKRRIIVVDVKEGTIHELNSYLPDDLRASTPEDVGTIIFLETEDQGLAGYQDIYTHARSGSATSREYTLYFMDVDDNSTNACITFFSEQEPPGSISSGEDWVTQPDLKQLAEYIRWLRRIE